MNNIIQRIRRELEKNADEKVKKSGERFFREKVKLYGLKAAATDKIGKKYYRETENRSKKEIFDLCEKLWRSGYLEEALIACDWSYSLRNNYKPEDFKVLEKWAKKYMSNWAACDTFCNHTVGAFVEMYPRYLENLKKWAKSQNRWMRRAAAVSLIVPARRGKFLKDVFQIADILLSDKEDMAQKGYGWMLKVASEAHEKKVFDYVMKNKNAMPRTALRYAIEKMPKNLKARAMAK